MSLSPESSFDDDAIEDAAAHWLLRRTEGLSPQQEYELKAWIGADPRHAAAITRLEQTCAMLERMPLVESALRPVEGRSPEASARRGTGPRAAWFQRSVFRRVALAAAAVLVLGFGWWRLTPPRDAGAALVAHHITASGSFERIDLTDGSVIKLNSDSAAEVRFSAHERRIVLARGEAYFTVAHDPARPFVVEAVGVAIRAVGTAFNVRIAADAVELLVTDGTVRLERPRPGSDHERTTARADSAASNPVLMVRAHQRALIALVRSADPVPLRIEDAGDAVIREALAWQDRMLVFHDTPLRDVAAQFNRHSRVQLRIGDDALAARRVVGTFAGDNVESFVRLLTSDGTVAVEQSSESEWVLRTAR
jgi:transmembrane sensor